MARKGRKEGGAGPETIDGPTCVRQFVVELYDRRDGTGVDWRMVADTLFKAAFQVLDQVPDDAQKKAIAGRVHASAYRRMTGDAEGDSGGSEGPGQGSRSPAHSARLKAFWPRPPH